MARKKSEAPPEAGARLPVTVSGAAVSFAVRVKPRASADVVVGLHGDALAVRLTAPPVEGAANEALCRFLAKRLGVPASAVEIVGGQTGRSKILRVTGVSAEAVRALAETS